MVFSQQGIPHSRGLRETSETGTLFISTLFAPQLKRKLETTEKKLDELKTKRRRLEDSIEKAMATRQPSVCC